MVIKETCQGSDLVRGPLIGKPQKDYALVRKLLAEDLLTKVFIICDQNTLIGKCLMKHRIIIESPRFCINGKDVVPLLSQPLGNSWSGAFVDDEAHLAGCRDHRHEGRALQRLGCKE